MNLEDISNIYQKNLNSFFRNEKIIELIYKEQFGSENYEKNKEQYHKKYNEIIDNTVFMPYITLEDLDNMLISARASYVSIYLEAYPDKEKDLNQKLETITKNIIQEYSSSLLNDLRQFFPNIIEDEYKKILENFSNTSFDNNTTFIENQLFKDTKNQLSKSQKTKVEEIIENYKKIVNEKIITEKNSIIEKTQKLYGSKYMETNFGNEINLSKKLNAQKKDIIKQYSSLMLDDFKKLFPELSKDEYYNKLISSSNKTFDENAKYIKDELFKDNNGIFIKIKKSKVERIIEKYKKLTDEKVLMETSSFYKHFLDVPNGKYYIDILETISNGMQIATQNIGKKTEKNIRYIFLPVFKYKNETEYLKNALHEVMHISKEQLSNTQYKSGIVVRNLQPNPHDSQLAVIRNPLANLWQSFKWSIISIINNLPKRSELYNNVQRNAFS